MQDDDLFSHSCEGVSGKVSIEAESKLDDADDDESRSPRKRLRKPAVISLSPIAEEKSSPASAPAAETAPMDLEEETEEKTEESASHRSMRTRRVVAPREHLTRRKQQQIAANMNK